MCFQAAFSLTREPLLGAPKARLLVPLSVTGTLDENPEARPKINVREALA